MTVHHKDPDNFFDNQEDFCHYFSWLLRDHKGTEIQTSTTHIKNEQMNGG